MSCSLAATVFLCDRTSFPVARQRQFRHKASAPWLYSQKPLVHTLLTRKPASAMPFVFCCHPVALTTTLQDFTVACTEPQIGWPQGFAVGRSFTAGPVDCDGTHTSSIPVNIATKPEVSLEGPTELKQVCSNASDVTVSYTASSGAAGTALTVTAVAKSAADVVLETVECKLPDAQGEVLLTVSTSAWLHAGQRQQICVPKLAVRQYSWAWVPLVLS
jgi:hypothetical protein